MANPEEQGTCANSSAPRVVRDTQMWLVNVMNKMNGSDPRLIIKKNLFPIDVSINHGRLSIPSKQVVEQDFLTALEEETEITDMQCGMKTILVDPRKRIWNVILRRWDLMKTSIYDLTSAWNDIVYANGFKQGDPIELWSFRSQGTLCFALVSGLNSSSKLKCPSIRSFGWMFCLTMLLLLLCSSCFLR